MNMGVKGMVRQARIQSPTDYYHIMMRGNNRESIFRYQSQKIFFLELLEEQKKEGSIYIAAYCIMDNHVHIIIKGELPNISKAIGVINTKYAIRFNNQSERIGHVFQERYKSEVITDDTYLLQVIRYVHNNPVSAKMVRSPNDYRWSSYREYLKEDIIVNKEQKDFVLGCYGSINQLIEFHKEKDDQEYLEIKEDIEQYREDKAKEIISMYLKEKGINETEIFNLDSIYLDEAIMILLKRSKLSHRQIGELLKISSSKVHRINKD